MLAATRAASALIRCGVFSCSTSFDLLSIIAALLVHPVSCSAFCRYWGAMLSLMTKICRIRRFDCRRSALSSLLTAALASRCSNIVDANRSSASSDTRYLLATMRYASSRKRLYSVTFLEMCHNRIRVFHTSGRRA